MANFAIPESKEIQQAMAMFFGDDTEVNEGQAIVPGSGKACQVAEFLADDDTTVAACACDSALAAYAGAALTMIPAPTAADAAKSGDLSKPMVDNMYEVMNILSRFLMNSSTPHLRLGKMYAEKDMPDTLKTMVDNKAEQIDYQIVIPNYGSGNISITVT